MRRGPVGSPFVSPRRRTKMPFVLPAPSSEQAREQERDEGECAERWPRAGSRPCSGGRAQDGAEQGSQAKAGEERVHAGAVVAEHAERVRREYGEVAAHAKSTAMVASVAEARGSEAAVGEHREALDDRERQVCP